MTEEIVSYGVLSLIPAILAVVLAFWTKNVIISLMASLFVGCLITAGWNPWNAMQVMFSDHLFVDMTGSSNAQTIIMMSFVGGFVALIEAVVGITAGVLWGYVRGLDFVFTELYNIFDNIPTAIVLILISYVATPSIWTMILGMSIKGWIEMARFIRNQILIIRDRDYNVASRCIGTPTLRIVLRNLLPYLVSVIMLRMALTIPEAIGNEVFITYIGLGLSVETPSLGNLVNDGRKVMMQAGLRYQLLYPTLILSFVTIAFYLIGNAFSDAADPKNHLQ